MGRQTFILLETKPFRRYLKLYMKNSEGKTDQRSMPFTTEHKINEKDRPKNARKVAAEFSTSDENIIDALYRDTGYGKTFVHEDDPEGKRKKVAFTVTPVDAKRIALSNLFDAAGLAFDPKKSVDVLNEEYSIHVSATAGVKIKASTATEITHKPVDVYQTMLDQANTARKVYVERYGESIPDEFTNDLGFLSALSDPNFDAEAYIKKNQAPVKEEEITPNPAETAESVQKLYFETFGVNVAPPKKNDLGWMKQKIKEKLAE